MSSKIILLVEDNPDDEALTIRALTKNNICNQVVVARDGEEALDILFSRGTYANTPMQMPELVLLDINLPKVSGFEVLNAVRNNPATKFLPVVILTTSNVEKDLLEGYRLGVNSYICKPVDFNQFSDAIKNLGLYWLVLNKTPQTK